VQDMMGWTTWNFLNNIWALPL